VTRLTFASLFAAALCAQQSPKAGDIKTNPKDGLRYAWVPPGAFRMGCANGDAECDDDESPAHAVRITRGFWMGQTEVPVAAYKRYLRAAGGSMPPEPKFSSLALNTGWAADNLPMNMVSWNDARDYCQWAGLRLPTEAEWEYAARAGSPAAQPAAIDELAWYADNSGDRRIDSQSLWERESNNFDARLAANANRPRPGAQKRPNGFQLYDMLGNLWEWVADWYGSGEYGSRGSREVSDPQGPPAGERRTMRGASSYNDPRDVRFSNRNSNAPANRFGVVGFRCSGELPSP
jgi:formylglycine-generating enzyme required for sulfatase activity